MIIIHFCYSRLKMNHSRDGIYTMPSRARDTSTIYESSTYPRPIDYACNNTQYYVNTLDHANISNDVIELITRRHEVRYYLLISDRTYVCQYAKPYIALDPKVYTLTVRMRLHDGYHRRKEIICIAQFYGVDNIGRFSIADNGVAHISGRPHCVEARNITLCIDDRSYISTLCNVNASIIFGDGTILDEYDARWVKKRVSSEYDGVCLSLRPLIKRRARD